MVMTIAVTFFDGFAVKKVMIVMLLPFFFWSFWSNSLKLKINNEMVFFLKKNYLKFTKIKMNIV